MYSDHESDLHILSVQICSTDHTGALLRMASGLHRRGVQVETFDFRHHTGGRCHLQVGFRSTTGQAETMRATLDGQIDVIAADLRTPCKRDTSTWSVSA